MTCKICGCSTYLLFDKQFQYNYYRCKNCDFIYEDPSHHMTMTEEREEYDRHNNSLEDEGYVNMFRRFLAVFKDKVKGSKLLEYGSGPEPVFSHILRTEGFDVVSYDPFYLPDVSYREWQYDVITSTEVFEHFSEPLKEFEHLISLLKEDGILAIMTQFPKDDEHFLNWWYRRDGTHISFYTNKTFEYLATRYNLEILFQNNKDYMIMRKLKSTD